LVAEVNSCFQELLHRDDVAHFVSFPGFTRHGQAKNNAKRRPSLPKKAVCEFYFS